MSSLLKNQRGISSIVGFSLVVALLMMAIGVYITTQVPVDWKTDEHDTMTEVRDAFLSLQNDIQGLEQGEAVSTVVRRGTPSPTAMMSASTSAELRVNTARDFEDATEAQYDDQVFSDWRGYGTYVMERGDSLVGMWHMDEESWNGTAGEVTDGSGRGNHGQAMNEVNTITSGKLSRAENCDGINDYVRVPDANSLDFTNAMTVMAWIKADTLSGNRAIVVKNGLLGDEFPSWRLYAHATWDDYPMFWFWEDLGYVHATTTLLTGVWYHIAATYDGSQTKIYVNGVLEGTTDYSGGIIPSDNSLSIGSTCSELVSPENPYDLFDGTIDEVSIWGRALTAEEINCCMSGYVGWNYTAGSYDNDHLIASTTQDQRIRAYLKFNLSDIYLYDSSNYVFYSDVEVVQAKLMLYCLSIDTEDEPDNKLEAAGPIVLEVWGVENDNWDERITWENQPHNQSLDVKLENQSVDGDQEWVAWDVTPYVKSEFEKYQNMGKWSQTYWYTEQAALESGVLASGYRKYNSNPDDVLTGNSLTGNGIVTSMVYDAGENNACWNYISYSYAGSAPTVEVRFANNPDMTGATPWLTQGASGPRDDMYARYVQYRVNPNGGTFYSIIIEFTCQLSFVLREPEYWGPTTVQNRVVFNSKDNTQASVYGFDPRLRVTYTRRERFAYVSEGRVDFGSIKYMAKNQYMYETNYVYEGGMVYLESGVGWYPVTLSEPQDFVTFSEADGNNINLTVTRYQIEAGSITGESTGGTGYTSIRVQRAEERSVVDPPLAPNRDKVTITINSDQPSLWGSYLAQLAASINYKFGGEWTEYGPYAVRDYDSVSLTVYGKDSNPEVQDIYYTEKVVWLDTTLGSFQGGRT